MGDEPSTIKATRSTPLLINHWKAIASWTSWSAANLPEPEKSQTSDWSRPCEGTTFIAADQEGFDSILAEAMAEHRPVAIFFPDGDEIVTA